MSSQLQFIIVILILVVVILWLIFRLFRKGNNGHCRCTGCTLSETCKKKILIEENRAPESCDTCPENENCDKKGEIPHC